MLLELLNREVPEPLVEHCVGLHGLSPTAASHRSTSAITGPDSIDEINVQLAVIKKYEKTLR